MNQQDSVRVKKMPVIIYQPPYKPINLKFCQSQNLKYEML